MATDNDAGSLVVPDSIIILQEDFEASQFSITTPQGVTTYQTEQVTAGGGGGGARRRPIFIMAG